MVICPVANAVGCNKCGIVNFCFLKTVLGNYGDDHMEVGGRVTPGADTEEQPGQDSEEAEKTKPKSRPPE